MAIAVTIGGVSKSYVGGSLRINYTANYHATASFAIRSNDASYRPAYDDEVVVSLDGTPILGGLIDKPGESGVLGDATGAYAAILTNVRVVDFSAYTARRYVSETLAAGTLKSMLTTLVTNYLSVYGISLSASQPDGPTLPQVVCTDVLLADVLNNLSTLTAKYGEQFVVSVDPSKVLLMAGPSTVTAPFDIPGAYAVIGDIKVETSGDNYANKVIVTVPQKTQMARVESFTGDGATTSFTPLYTPFNFRTFDDVTNNLHHTVNKTGDAESADYTYDPGTNTITSNIGAPAVGVSLTWNIDGTLAGRVTATDASWTANPRERLIALSVEPDDTTLQAFADGLLARYLQLGKAISYKTFGPGLLPGQLQHITFAGRNLDDDAVITNVIAQDYGERGHRMLFQVTAVTGGNIPDQLQDTYKLWATGSGGGAVTTTTMGAGAPSSVGPGGPDKAVQFNRAGAFGGKAEFSFYYQTNSVAMGTLSSIDGALPDSCAAIGYDCHVAD